MCGISLGRRQHKALRCFNISKSIVERVPFRESWILLQQTLLAGLEIRVLNAVHPWIGLEHQSFQNPLVLNGFFHTIEQSIIACINQKVIIGWEWEKEALQVLSIIKALLPRSNHYVAISVQQFITLLLLVRPTSVQEESEHSLDFENKNKWETEGEREREWERLPQPFSVCWG